MRKIVQYDKKTAILFAIAFLISFFARMYWVDYASNVEEYKFNNQVMINTNDGYFYAEGARDLLAGSHETGDRSAVTEPVAYATMILYKLLPFISFETLILYMPAFFGSLVVIPIILIGRAFEKTEIGFFAAVFASITYSYYNRTMAGYYDSDMFALIMPPFVAAFLISYFKDQNKLWQALLLFSFALSKLLYPQSFTWMLGAIGFAFLYTVVFERKNKHIYLTLALSLVMISDLPFLAKVLLTGVAAYYTPLILSNLKILISATVVSAAAFALFGGIDPIVSAAKAYLFKDSLTVKTTLKYYDVVQTVREAGRMDINLFASRISGSMPVFILSLIGFALFVRKEKLFALTLPMFGLGLFAYFGGLRFPVYAVPFAALGLFFFVFWLISSLKGVAKTSIATIALALMSIPNLYHIYGYTVPTVFTAQTVKQLDALGKIAKHEDYVFAWWDYGYPIRYYSNVKNHSDGGKHDGATNFIESFILCNTNQRASANMMRESVEGYEELIKKGEEVKKGTLEHLLEKRGLGVDNYQQYLDLLSKPDFVAAPKTRDVYLFLPYEMFEIFTTVKLFSNIDLKDGTAKTSPFLGIYTDYKEDSQTINLGDAIIDKVEMRATIGKNSFPIKTSTVSYFDKNGSFVSRHQSVKNGGEMHLVFLPSYHTYMLMDDEVFNSTFVQLFVLENYDKNLFEKVSETPEAKIFRLKI